MGFSQTPLNHMGAGRECGERCDSLGLWFLQSEESTGRGGRGKGVESKCNEVMTIDCGNKIK